MVHSVKTLSAVLRCPNATVISCFDGRRQGQPVLVGWNKESSKQIKVPKMEALTNVSCMRGLCKGNPTPVPPISKTFGGKILKFSDWAAILRNKQTCSISEFSRMNSKHKHNNLNSTRPRLRREVGTK